MLPASFKEFALKLLLVLDSAALSDITAPPSDGSSASDSVDTLEQHAGLQKKKTTADLLRQHRGTPGHTCHKISRKLAFRLCLHSAIRE